MNLWNHSTFSQLFARSPREAFEYRLRTNGVAIPAEYLTEEEKKALENDGNANKATVAESSEASGGADTENGEKNELSASDLRSKLREAGITFSNAAPIEVLVKKCQENNLL